jgi:addiction module HigA family antidote
MSFEYESVETKSSVLRYTPMRSARPNDPDNFAHSGALLKRDVPAALGPSVMQPAIDLKVTRQTLYRILAGTALITLEMALHHLKWLTAIAATIWIELQDNYDLHRAKASALP